ncbi:MAG TPA: hypothetical protein VHR66_16570 [Gemmataceae bacterium]|jgi:hypothetical protein|nr:hypothetical protein [Gemmataceae bacterium]
MTDSVQPSSFRATALEFAPERVTALRMRLMEPVPGLETSPPERKKSEAVLCPTLKQLLQAKRVKRRAGLGSSEV